LSLSPEGQRVAIGAQSSVTVVQPGGAMEVQSVSPIIRNRNWPMAGWSSDGSLFAASASDEKLRLWKADGTPGPEFQGDVTRVTGFEMSPDGKSFAVFKDSKLAFWKSDGSAGPKVEMDRVQGFAQRISWNPDSRTVAVQANKDILIFGADGTKTGDLKGHTEKITEIRWSPDGSSLASSSLDGTIRVWKPDGTVESVTESGTGDADSFDWSKDGKKLICGYDSGHIAVWTVGGERLAEWHAHEDSVMSLTVSPDGKTIASAGWDKILRLWTIEGEPIREICGSNGAFYFVRWSPDSKKVVTTASDLTVRTWIAETGQLDSLLRYSAEAPNRADGTAVPKKEPEFLIRNGRLNLKQEEMLGNEFYVLVETKEGATEIKTFPEFRKLAGSAIE
jgi:WD40 repeat protein